MSERRLVIRELCISRIGFMTQTSDSPSTKPMNLMNLETRPPPNYSSAPRLMDIDPLTVHSLTAHCHETLFKGLNHIPFETSTNDGSNKEASLVKSDSNDLINDTEATPTGVISTIVRHKQILSKTVNQVSTVGRMYNNEVKHKQISSEVKNQVSMNNKSHVKDKHLDIQYRSSMLSQKGYVNMLPKVTVRSRERPYLYEPCHISECSITSDPWNCEDFATMLGDSLIQHLDRVRGCQVLSYPGMNIDKLIKNIKSGSIPELKKKREIYLLLIGTNDIRSVPLAKIKNSFNYLISLIQRLFVNCSIMLCEIPPRARDYFDTTLDIITINDYFWELSKTRNRVYVIPTFHPFITNGLPNLNLYYDLLHFDTDGIKKIHTVVTHHLNALAREINLVKPTLPGPVTVVRRWRNPYRYNRYPKY